MKYIAYLLLFTALNLLIISCNSARNRYIPVFHNRPRVSTLGFTISPPPGTNWYEKVSDESLYYLKRLKPKDYFIYTKATELHFNKRFTGSLDFLNYVKAKKELNTDPRQFQNVTFSAEPVQKDGMCVLYSQQYEDHGKKDLQKNKVFYAQVNSSGLICIHPSRPDIGIDVYYLERAIPGSISKSYAHEGEQFIASLTFTKL